MNYPQTTAQPISYVGGPGGPAVRAATDRVLLLDGEITTVQSATEKVRSLTASMRGIADSVFGAQPSEGDKSIRPDPVWNGRGDGLRTATGSLHEAISALDRELTRFTEL